MQELEMLAFELCLVSQQTGQVGCPVHINLGSADRFRLNRLLIAKTNLAEKSAKRSETFGNRQASNFAIVA